MRERLSTGEGSREPLPGTVAAEMLASYREQVAAARLVDQSLPLIVPHDELSVKPDEIEDTNYAHLVRWIQLIRASGFGRHKQ